MLTSTYRLALLKPALSSKVQLFPGQYHLVFISQSQSVHKRHFGSPMASASVNVEGQAAALNPDAKKPKINPNQKPRMSFYKRKLPSPPATAFSSTEGKEVFTEALLEGNMNGFFKLIEQFSTQDEPAFCGLSSLAIVLNALAIDPRRTWKGAWRWFHEKLLDCCKPLDEVAEDGTILTEVACLARCNGAKVTSYRHGDFTLEEFRQQVMEVSSSGQEHIVVSYSRKAFMQTGDGHFSPVGGYHPGRDLVLILDTARFKYPPHWVPLPLLFDAMGYIDPDTGKPRGFLRLAAHPRLDSLLFTLDIRSSSWNVTVEFVQGASQRVQALLTQHPGISAQDVVRKLLRQLPFDSLVAFIATRPSTTIPNATTTSTATPITTATHPHSRSIRTHGTHSPGAHTLADTPNHSLCHGSHSHTETQPHNHECTTVTHTRTQGDCDPPPSPSSTPLEEGLQRLGSGAEVRNQGIIDIGMDGSSCTPRHVCGDPQHGQCIPSAAQQQLLHEIRNTPLFQAISSELEQLPPAPTPLGALLPEKVTMLMLALLVDELVPHWTSAEDREAMIQLMDCSKISLVETEVAYLREQFRNIHGVSKQAD